VVEALEGRIAPIECFSTVPDGSIHCVLASDPARVCTSKILWSRVREAIVATLEQMTLADLIPASTATNAATTTNAITTTNASTTTTTTTPTSPTTTTSKKAVAA
jgi:DNA-binding IscR family transcriptional regulator